MAKSMAVKVCVLIVIAIAVISYSTEAGAGVVPLDAIEFAYGKVDSYLSCSKYAGFAGCWYNDEERAQRYCSSANNCSRGDTWSYKFSSIFGGTCYCCKCN